LKIHITIEIGQPQKNDLDTSIKTSLDSLGHTIKMLRGFKSLSESANDIGISKATLSRIENGSIPDLFTFQKICQHYNLNLKSIIEDQGN